MLKIIPCIVIAALLAPPFAASAAGKNDAPPAGIRGQNTAVNIDAWPEIEVKRIEDSFSSTLNESLLHLIDGAVNRVYP